MWCAFSKIFTNNCNDPMQSGDFDGAEMDRGDGRRPDMDLQDTYDTRQAKQRASVKWLLSKAFNNKVPENLKEPFYRDIENQEHLKPQIAGALANAEMYCLALGNIYSDPNYHNLNHWSILQTLARKGVYVSGPNDSQLTETTLIQTNPLRMSAHMSVIESIMVLYAKEVVTSDRVQAAVYRFNHEKPPTPSALDNHERGLLYWVSQACEALKKRMQPNGDMRNGGDGDKAKSPSIPAIRDFKDLCDGVALAALVSYYCPDELSWTDIKISYLPTVSESLHNLGLVNDFCLRCIPASIFHMMPEDITYMRGSMKQNFVVFLADLFNVLEMNPVKCVRYPGMDKSSENFPPRNEHGVVHKRNLPQSMLSPIPDLRSGLDDPSTSTTLQVVRTTSAHSQLRKTNSFQQSATDMSEDSLRRGSDDSFVVHRGKNIPTLSSILQDDPQSKYRKEDDKAAGKPSNWQDNKRSSYSGRRSRRNSVSEDSQLTIENFGGSQDNLNFIGRNPDKEVGAHVGRKLSTSSNPSLENPAVRSSKQDARGSIQLGYDNGCEKRDDEKDVHGVKGGEELSLKTIIYNKENLKEVLDGENGTRMSFAELSKSKSFKEQGGIQLVYMQNEKFDSPSKSSFLNKSNSSTTNGEKKTTFATLPNTTTWQQQSSSNQVQVESDGDETNGTNNVMASQLNDIRMKLEEKRRNIESEKRRMEMALNKQRQKVGKAAFLQAVVKGKGSALKTPSDSESNPTACPDTPTSIADSPKSRLVTEQDIADEASNVERKWFESETQTYLETRKTPDIENMDLEQYHQSIAQMNSSLHDIQADIQRLASQQNHITQQQYSHQQMQQTHLYPTQQTLNSHQGIYHPLQTSASAPHLPQSMYRPISPRTSAEPQFFLHEQSRTPQHQPVPQRRTWAQNTMSPPIHNESNQWNQQSTGFTLHENTDRFQDKRFQQPHRYQNGGEASLHNVNHPSFTLSQQHTQQQHAQQLYSASFNSPTSSPQHRNIHKQISQLIDEGGKSLNHIERKSSITHAPIPAPPVDDMEPQSISFIGNPDEDLSENLSRLNITSGTRTYRIPSPTRPMISRNAFKPDVGPDRDSRGADTTDDANQKGFYISFDNEQPKRPKPPLRVKRGSPRKERGMGDEDGFDDSREVKEKNERIRELERELEEERLKKEVADRKKREQVREASQEKEKVNNASALIIGNDLSNPNPDLIDERERKKEKIMLLSLQRRQQQEEAKQRKEQEAQMRRDREKLKEEEKQRKKEEQMQRRAAIFEQYKLKKAIEEAEREGKDVDKSLLNSLKPVPKLRAKGSTSRPRPKTIHIDSGSVEMAAEGILTPSRGKKGSTSNLTANAYTPSTMRRDYFRGSQDSLADRGLGSSGLLYKDSPSDSRGISPCHSANQTLNRRSSYKTSRDPSPAQVRGRPKLSTYQNFKGRKSNSMMNLYGSSTDQDSMAYRYGDTDSGLGRATPPRRAPSPGMGPMRHLPSPSGPGSLPGMMTKRRIFDDGSSDISSTPSSMMDYNGPRLYKQPATKSNRGIMLNAVEYCVFPGVVNKEAKRRVLEEIARSESKHFLILFRDAGCQFRALYSYCPDREEVLKLYGTGPKQVNDRMFDKFFKYNSGGKCFSQVHTKHLTVTIDAFTIHNSLWQGKKVNLPNKKDMALVI